MSYQEIRKIRNDLKKTWKHFFRPFGGRLYQIQVEAIPPILDGNNVILQSPTASGKTEAVMAPLIENLFKTTYEAPAIIYICPTRALVYDIYERIHQQIEDMGLSIAIRTGEIRQFKPNNPQDIIITTPESLDSMLCRNQKIIRNLEYVVLDELHLLHGSYRGDQLHMDLLRLEELALKTIQYCALSATFKNPEDIAPLYFSPFKVIKVSGARKIEYELIDYQHKKLALTNILEAFKKKRVRKAIFFCNSRRGTEEIAQIMKEIKTWPSERIHVHHGSLGKTERLFVETSMKQKGRLALCAATMTLEVGIDIGDIDMIVLIHPPPGVSSLLQRIGRGNRRKNITRAIGCYKNMTEHDEFNNLFTFAINGELEVIEGGPCLSVAFQQILSVLYQKRWRGETEEYLINFLLKLPMQEEHIRMLFESLMENDYIVISRERYFPSVKTVDLGDRGFIHANIPGSIAYNVVNEMTGSTVGEIATFDTINNQFVLSGKRWYVESIEGSKIRVTEKKSRDSEIPYFSPAKKHGKYFYLLPPELQEICCES